ncbi:MAG: ATP-binding protein [Candidatus Aminicenantes bacterium]|nr:MAG: ATP-binding protein [Candidatus Aminicenantes bacterium]
MTVDTKIPKPRNSLELFKWLIFEPIILRKYSTSLNRPQTIREFLKSYVWIIIISTIIFLLLNLIIAVFDLPSKFPEQFDKKFLEGWQPQAHLFSKFIFISLKKAFGLAVGLAGGLAVGLAFGLAFGLTFGLAYGLTFGLVFGLAGGLAFGLAGGLTVGLAGGLAFGLAGGIAGGLAFGLAVGLAGGLAGELAGLLGAGLAMGGGVIIGWNIFYFRILPFYPVHFIKSMFCNKLSNNPYRDDGVIWLPIWGLNSKLVQQAKKEPEKAFEFINFLLEYRPLQKTLAMNLTHAATVGTWLENEFNADALKTKPIIAKDKPKFQPSEEWIQNLAAVREELVTSEQQSNIGYKLEYFERYLTQLKEFDQINLRESSRWNHYYFDAFKKWIQLAEEDYERLELVAKTREPITRNVYRAGDALTPEFDKSIFIGREDLRDELQNKILSTPQMPMFLILGQRRVGKTSLLKFLSGILGTRFKVVYMDLHPMGSIYEWLTGLKKEFDHAIGIEYSPLPGNKEKNWLETWKALQNHLEESAKKQEYKIILAFDEYEKAHYYFQKDPEAAENLLAAMRSFSQHQNKIVFLFVGASLFSELQNPHWSNYFVQAILLKVDYLKKDETFKLINVVNLEYPKEVMEEIYHLTQGHPTLVQRICHEMVNIANTQHRKKMTTKDLEEILEKHIYRPQNGVTEVFWGQFCQAEAMKTTVRQIIDGKTAIDKKSLFKLSEHGFVVKEKDHYKMRVPIFEKWVKEFGEVID